MTTIQFQPCTNLFSNSVYVWILELKVLFEFLISILDSMEAHYRQVKKIKYDLVSRTYDLVSRTYDLVSHTYEILSRTYEILSHTYDIAKSYVRLNNFFYTLDKQ